MSHHIVEARDLHYIYADGTPGIRGVSFRITHGKSVAIVGENGAGKSTTIKMLMGMVHPTRGSATVLGEVKFTSDTMSHLVEVLRDHNWVVRESAIDAAANSR